MIIRVPNFLCYWGKVTRMRTHGEKVSAGLAVWLNKSGYDFTKRRVPIIQIGNKNTAFESASI